jgi:polar amino acid transport system substrate-binding protein
VSKSSSTAGHNFLRKHHNAVVTNSGSESLRMLAAGHVDYAVVNLQFGIWDIAKMGYPERSSRYCPAARSKTMFMSASPRRGLRPSFVDAFSRALKQFKQTGAYHAILLKYSP